MLHAHLVLVRETTEMILRRMEELPVTDRTSVLRECARDCAGETAHWNVSPPTPRELDVMAKRLFVLHVEATKLERGAAFARAVATTS